MVDNLCCSWCGNGLGLLLLCKSSPAIDPYTGNFGFLLTTNLLRCGGIACVRGFDIRCQDCVVKGLDGCETNQYDGVISI